MPKVADRILMWAPEHWGQVDRFQKFSSTTHKFDDRQQRALAGVGAHFDKAQRLMRLAARLAPALELDEAELEEKGFTPAEHARELATVAEAAILELYSSVDCTVKVLRAIYGPGTPGFRDSTRGLFQRISKMAGTFPEALKPCFAEASWYWRLVHLRDELTHLATGHCHLDKETRVIRYDHYGLKQDDKPLVIDDLFAWLGEMSAAVNQFLGAIFHHLNANLVDKPIWQPCGMVEGRMLHRWVSPVGELTFHSGACGAWVWFEQPQNPTCPFAEGCGAYRNKAPPQGWETDPPATTKPGGQA
jgi:hypothetical protein